VSSAKRRKRSRNPAVRRSVIRNVIRNTGIESTNMVNLTPVCVAEAVLVNDDLALEVPGCVVLRLASHHCGLAYSWIAGYLSRQSHTKT
jgi:hypothetical protein